MLGGSVATVVLALLAVAESSVAITIPLQKRDLSLKNADGSVNIAGLQVEASRLSKKYERNRKNWRFNAFGEDPTKRNSRKRATMQLTEQDYAVWTGKVAVGTPAQNLDIYFDSGSSDFTVASTNCPTSSCGTKHRYDTSASSTSVTTSRTITTNFVDGTSSSGTLVEDTVTAGGLTATGQDIIAATSLSSTVSGLASDGLYASPTMGLAYPSLSQAFSASLPFTLNAQGQGGRPQWFGLSLRSQGTSQLTLGGYNRARTTGQIRWYNVKLEDGSSFRTYWQIGGSAPFVNSAQASSSRVNMILDSGTTLIIAPSAAATAFWNAVPGAQKYDDNFWSYPCASPPTVEFSFARVTLQMYTVSAYDFNLGYLAEDSTRCIGAVITQNVGLGSSWILGDAFLTNWYVIHDVANNRIGLGANR
ncbi:hypothetical protein JCM6882_002475 [Rhodosporidiobolus microsporus]